MFLAHFFKLNLSDEWQHLKDVLKENILKEKLTIIWKQDIDFLLFYFQLRNYMMNHKVYDNICTTLL